MWVIFGTWLALRVNRELHIKRMLELEIIACLASPRGEFQMGERRQIFLFLFQRPFFIIRFEYDVLFYLAKISYEFCVACAGKGVIRSIVL